MAIRRHFRVAEAASLVAFLLVQTPAFSSQANNESVVGERFAQGTTSSLEVPPSGKPVWETANLLRVELDSFQLVEEGKVAALLTFINKTKEDLTLRLGTPYKEKTFALDEQGIIYGYEMGSGLSPGSGLLCPASGKATATLIFSPSKRKEGHGWRFTITSELYFTNSKGIGNQLNVSFQEVRPQNVQMQGR